VVCALSSVLSKVLVSGLGVLVVAIFSLRHDRPY
jgi:hypothetical protein